MPLAANAAVVPRNLDVEDTLMRRPEGFDHCVARRGPMLGLKFLLQHRLVIGLRGAQRIRGFELSPQRTTNKLRRSFESTVEKNRARDGFENIGEQRVLVAAATLLFTATEAQEVAELQSLDR